MQPQRTGNGYSTSNAYVCARRLTPRTAQYAVLAAGEGISNKEIAQRLNIKETSANKLAQQLYYTLNVSNMQQAMITLYRQGLIKYLCVLACIISTSTAIPSASANTEDLNRHRPARIRIRAQAKAKTSKKQ